MGKRISKKLNLNRYGLIILGAALYEHQLKLEGQLKTKNGNVSVDSKLCMIRPLKDNQGEICKLKKSIRTNLDYFEAQPSDYKEGRSAKFSTFQFDWWHLYDHKILTAYCNPNLMAWTGVSQTYDKELIIADMTFHGKCHDALQMIFIKESQLLLEYGDMEDGDSEYTEHYKNNHVRTPRTEDEILFFLMVSDYCNPRRNIHKGKPIGSGRNELALQKLVPVARQLRSKGLSKNAAAKSALEQLKISIVPVSSETKITNVFYSASDRSAHNSIVMAMDDSERYE